MINLTLRTLTSPYGDTTKNSVLSHSEVDSNFIGLKGELIITGTSTNNLFTLNKLDGSDITIPINSDVIVKRKRFTYSGSSTPRLLADAVNNLSTFTINPNEIYIFVTAAPESMPEKTYKFFLKNHGAGTYGVGGTQIGAIDIELVYQDELTYNDIINNPTTQTILLGELSGATVSDFLNNYTPPVSIQSQLDGYTIIDTLQSSEQVQYLFLGTGGTYGFNNLQTTDSDFQLLSLLPNGGDIYVTGGTLNNGTATFRNNSGGTFSVSGFAVTGLTGTGTTGYIPVFKSGNTFGNSLISQYVSPPSVIINENRTNLYGTTFFSIQRGQTQIDFSLGNPDASQISNITSDNRLGLVFGSKGYLKFAAGDSYTELMTLSGGTILIGTGMTATTNNTTYVANIVLKKLSGVPINSGDSLGENGSITWDDNYFYWKANSQWRRISGSTF